MAIGFTPKSQCTYTPLEQKPQEDLLLRAVCETLLDSVLGKKVGWVCHGLQTRARTGTPHAAASQEGLWPPPKPRAGSPAMAHPVPSCVGLTLNSIQFEEGSLKNMVHCSPTWHSMWAQVNLAPQHRRQRLQVFIAHRSLSTWSHLACP